jgi:hypothetical protein
MGDLGWDFDSLQKYQIYKWYNIIITNYDNNTMLPETGINYTHSSVQLPFIWFNAPRLQIKESIDIFTSKSFIFG